MTGRASPAYAEDKIQAAIVAYVRSVAPEVIVAHIPNGGWRDKRQAAKFRWLGVLAGMPDLIICAPNGVVGFVEIKTETGELSKEQRVVRNLFMRFGIKWALARSIDNMRVILDAWQIDTRETAEIKGRAA